MIDKPHAVPSVSIATARTGASFVAVDQIRRQIQDASAEQSEAEFAAAQAMIADVRGDATPAAAESPIVSSPPGTLDTT